MTQTYQRSSWPAPQRLESPTMTGLRAVTYTLTSVASLLFIALVIYGYLKVGQMQAAFEGAFGPAGFPTVQDIPLPPAPPAPR